MGEPFVHLPISKVCALIGRHPYEDREQTLCELLVRNYPSVLFKLFEGCVQHSSAPVAVGKVQTLLFECLKEIESHPVHEMFLHRRTGELERLSEKEWNGYRGKIKRVVCAKSREHDPKIAKQVSRILQEQFSEHRAFLAQQAHSSEEEPVAKRARPNVGLRTGGGPKPISWVLRGPNFGELAALVHQFAGDEMRTTSKCVFVDEQGRRIIVARRRRNRFFPQFEPRADYDLLCLLVKCGGFDRGVLKQTCGRKGSKLEETRDHEVDAHWAEDRFRTQLLKPLTSFVEKLRLILSTAASASDNAPHPVMVRALTEQFVSAE